MHRVVAVSSLGRDYPGRSGLLGAAFAMDTAIEATCIDYRALRMPYFMENLLAHVPAIAADGVVTLPSDVDRTLATVATRDISEVEAQMLLDADWSGQASVPVIGPDDLSPSAMADVITQVLGPEVRAVHVPSGQHKTTLVGHGLSEAWAQGLIDMTAAQDDGIYVAEAAASERTPTTFAQWCRDTLEPAMRTTAKNSGKGSGR